MIQTITDSLFFYKNNPDYIYTSELFRWEINTNNKYSLLSKKKLNKDYNLEDQEIIGIVSPSNYKLQFELKELNTKKIFIPEFYKYGKPFKVDYSKIDILFDKYLKRSYLSFLNYENLRNIGLNRIEQFILLGNSYAISKFKNEDNLLLNEKLTITHIEEIKEEEMFSNKIKMLDFIKTISIKKNINFDEASKLIIQQYGLLNISDPFLEEGFIILKKISDISLHNLCIKILKTKIKVKTYKCSCINQNKKEKIIYIKKTNDNIEEDLYNYYNLQKNNYNKNDIIEPTLELDNINLIYQSIQKIIPLKDFILTLKSLIKLNKIENKNNFIFVNEETVKKLNIKKNLSWLSEQTWEKIYNEQSYIFNNIISEINTENLEFCCPLCGYKEINISPLKFFCKNVKCNFTFDRTTLNIVEVKAIQEEKMIEALQNKKIFIKNKNNKNFVVYLKNDNNYYFLSLKE